MADTAHLTPAELLAALARQGISVVVEGDELVVHGRRELLTAELRDALAAQKPHLLRWLAEEDLDGVHRPSYGQRGLFHVQQLAPESPAYNVAVAARVVSEIDPAALDAALVELVRRHHALRSSWGTLAGEQLLRIERAPKTILEREDAPHSEGERRAALLRALRRPFVLQRGPMLRAALFTRQAYDHDLLLVVHHTAADFWALRPLLDELLALYGGRTPAPPAAQALDIAAWEERMLASDRGRDAEAYWRGRLSPPPPVLRIPVDRPRPAARALRGASHPFDIDPELIGSLRRTARASGATLFAVLLSAFQTLLHRMTAQNDIVVGTPVARREEPRLSPVVGYAANLVPIRTDFTGNPTFAEVVAQVREATLQAIDHASYPFPLMTELLRRPPDVSRPPLCQAVFALHNLAHFGPASALFRRDDGRAVELGALRLRPRLLEQQEGQFDLAMELIEEGDRVAGTLAYDSALHEPRSAARIVAQYLGLLAEAAREPRRAVSALPFGCPAAGIAHPPADFGAAGPALIHRRFEQAAAAHPDSVALVSDEAAMTYAELDRRSSALAARLRAAGVSPDVRVGVCIERGFDTIVAILAVLKAGGAYVPLDPAYPAERLAYMLADSAPAAVVVSPATAGALPPSAVPLLAIDETVPAADAMPFDSGAHPGHAAYVMYTSGSTGRPKGVVVTHANVTRLFDATIERFAFTATDTGIVCHSFSFDFSTWEIWGALFHGGRLVLPAADVTRSAADLAACLARHGVTVLNQTPTSFLQLSSAILDAAPRRPFALRLVMFGGEALDYGALRRWLDRYGDASPELVNLFGITETTVHVTARRVRRADLDQPIDGSLIGPPLPNVRLHLLDGAMQPVPVGIAGELYVGGTGVSRGYLNDPAQTARKFVADPFATDGRLYRSGDVARIREDGELEYLGRADEQVQLRGVRIELPEIEAVLRRHDDVASAVVHLAGDSQENRRLVAYVVPRASRDVDPVELLEACRASLPRAMVPSAFLTLRSLPMTPTGKLDRAALPDPEPQRIRAAGAVEPRNESEARLAGLWREVLRVPGVAIDDDFFDLGGNSLLATQLASRVRDAFGTPLPLELLFRTPTIRRHAEFLEAVAAVTTRHVEGEHEEIAI